MTSPTPEDLIERAAGWLDMWPSTASPQGTVDLISKLAARIRELERELSEARKHLNSGYLDRLASESRLQEANALIAEAAEVTDERRDELKGAFVAGCCAVLTWTHSGMPQDDLDEAGYDYAANTSTEAAKLHAKLTAWGEGK